MRTGRAALIALLVACSQPVTTTNGSRSQVNSVDLDTGELVGSTIGTDLTIWGEIGVIGGWIPVS